MPSITTHHLFSIDALNKCTNIKNSISSKQNIYHIFAQSFDNLFYYNLLSFKSGKTIRKFGNTAQQTRINDYFKNIILSIKELKLEQNEECLAYLYGSLTHYILDSFCHPFVIYYAGWIDEDNLDYQYRGNHEKIEVNIDAIYWKEKQHKDLYKESLGNVLLPKVKFSKELKDIITLTFERTFNQKNMGNIYEKSTHQGHYIIKYFVTDHFGIKKMCYKIFDAIFSKNKTKYQNLSFYVKKPNYKFLNRNHEIWYHPANNHITSTDSFDDLYQKALIETQKIFELTDQLIKDKIELNDYLKSLGNRSYTTGLNWNKKVKFHFFKNDNLE